MGITHARTTARESKLMTATVVAFSLAYLVMGYLLFFHAMKYVLGVPAIGALASERIIHLMYFFFFIMLVFSNAVLGYASLFKNKTTGWLLTLPIDHRAIFSYRIIETLAFSSWGLVFLSAPLLLAYGHLVGAPVAFYFKIALAYIPFLLLPAGISSWLLLVIVRRGNRWWGIIAATLLLGYAAYAFLDTKDTMSGDSMADTSIALAFNKVLKHTAMSTHPFMPSNWMSTALLDWTRGSGGSFNILLLSSYALMAGLVTTVSASRRFFPTWLHCYRARAARAIHSSRPGLGDLSQRFLCKPRFAQTLPRHIRALIRKDVLTFIREPSQWGQVAVIIGLLFLYVINLGNIEYTASSPFWTIILSYLNLGVCSLALSTLTTRFVFPQFSLEGRRLWILGLAPFPITTVIWVKFALASVLTGCSTAFLVTLSGTMLALPSERIAFLACSISIMALTLTSLSTSLGTLFPNLRETNPAKIVSGFGGTLCLLLSFLYISLGIFLTIRPEFAMVVDLPKNIPKDETYLFSPPPYSGIAILAIISLIIGGIPMFLAFSRVKNLEFLGKL